MDLGSDPKQNKSVKYTERRLN